MKKQQPLSARKIIKKEQYLFKLARKTLEFYEVEYTEKDLADLVMTKLLNINE